MSSKYRQVNISQVDNLTDMTQDGLEKLKLADPLLYRKLMSVDLNQLTNYVLVESAKGLAQEIEGRFVAKKRDLSTGYYNSEALPSGEFLGAVEKGNHRLIFIKTHTGLRCVQQISTHGGTPASSSELDEMEAKFRQIYRCQAMVAYSSLLSDGKVEVSEQGDYFICKYEREV